MRASGLSQDSYGEQRGSGLGMRKGHEEGLRGAAPGREERLPRMRGGFFLIVRMGREALFRKRDADDV